MLKLNYYYDHQSAQLQLEGVPDYSVGQSEEVIGIISKWKLKISGFPELEGEKEHLIKLMQVIYAYTRFYQLGIQDRFGDDEGPIYICKCDNGHELYLEENANIELIINY